MKKLLLLIAAAIVSMAVNADPITVYVQQEAPFTIKKIYAWNGSTKYCGDWPGADITDSNSTTINGVNYYYYTFAKEVSSVNVIFHDNGGNQTSNIEGITASKALKINSSKNAEDVSMQMATPEISVSGYSVHITCADTEAQIFYTLDGTEPTASSTLFEGDFDITETKTVKAIAIREGFTSSAIAEKTVTPADPSTAITVYVQKKDGFTKIYAWYKDSEENTQYPCGSWGGADLTESETVADVEYWKYTFDASITSVNVIFNGSAGQTTNIEGITETTYYQILDEKDGSGHYKWETVTISTSTKVETPTLFQYMNNMVKLECATAGATIHYYYGEEEISADNWTDYTEPFRFNDAMTIKAIATCDGLDNSDAMVVDYTPNTFAEGAITVGVKIPDAPFTPSHIYAWTDGVEYIDKAWPGHEFTDNEKVYIDGVEYYCYVFDPKYTSVSVIFNNNSGSQTVDITDVTGEAYYEILSDKDGSKYKITFLSDVSEVEDIITDNIVTENVQIEYYNLYGIKIENPQHGIYIRKCGNKTEKVVL